MVAASAIAAVSVAVWWAVTTTPSWRKTVPIVAADAQEIQDSSYLAAVRINNPMGDDDPYEFSIGQRELNRWLARPEAVVPDLFLRHATDQIPDWIQDPQVIFDEGRITASVRIVQTVFSTVLSVTLLPQVDGRSVRIDIESVRSGVLPIPVGRFREWASGAIDSENAESHKLQRLLDGESIPNRFVWPNGRRVFSITKIHVEPGTIWIGFDPE
jgi:hypothetical protein